MHPRCDDFAVSGHINREANSDSDRVMAINSAGTRIFACGAERQDMPAQRSLKKPKFESGSQVKQYFTTIDSYKEFWEKFGSRPSPATKHRLTRRVTNTTSAP